MEPPASQSVVTNTGCSYFDEVSPQSLKKGTKLLEFYAKAYTHTSRASWQDKIARGQIKINGVVTTDVDAPLKIGMKLEYFRPPWTEPSIPSDARIVFLYEDDHVCVVNKPSEVPVLPGGQFSDNTVLNMIKYGRSCYGNKSADSLDTSKYLYAPVHRLGRGTSGALLFAKTALGRKYLTTAFREHDVGKVYLALMSGLVTEDEFEVNQPIGQFEYKHCRLTGFLWAAVDGGKPSHSIFKVLRRDTEKNETLCEVTITTGRPHQIRIHSAYKGHPLVGDPLYIAGGVPSDDTAFVDEEQLDDGDVKPEGPLPGDCGYYLHSWKCTWKDPITHESKNIVAPPPPRLQAILDATQ